MKKEEGYVGRKYYNLTLFGLSEDTYNKVIFLIKNQFDNKGFLFVEKAVELFWNKAGEQQFDGFLSKRPKTLGGKKDEL